ncbi:NAD(P)/FAD-dependent oxidoreductase [Dokdonia sinensis]|uniref:NAD(P)/FAD-dependent oxidoreductase n=1 Tax=Dokdonia sinensis TaxID=2479847 RepID=A0A3M0GHN9_9FLAO|nr:NAD(P)/FAD-dependent oxidoreductase [Dokdonia sinensis]RMB61103.1 NAD(P)/FAD-dependent oxidoreductase [Dokdonia sinensis]
MKKQDSIIIIGGGIAGLTAAIHLAGKGCAVQLIEKQSYPKHKVCGEYLSNEVLPYLKHLGIEPFAHGATNITHFHFTGFYGNGLETELPLGGFGMSRYTFDKLLYDRAIALGVDVIKDEVTSVSFSDNIFELTLKIWGTCTADYIIGAYGKRSGLDITLSRKFIQHKSPWLGVKAHYKADFPDHLVGLHHFKGGYCGLSKVEGNKINVCYLADYESFKKYKSLEIYQKEVLEQNSKLKSFFSESEMVFEKPLSISQISFEKKTAVENHILMVGDSAGLIHPLCGNGMAMAIHSAKIVSQALLSHFEEQTTRAHLETSFTQEWNHTFNARMRNGSIIQRGLQSTIITKLAVNFLRRSPRTLTKVIKSTHGTPI